MKRVLSLLALLPATPAVAASKNPFSLDFYKLSNTDFIVTLAFLLFVGVLVYYRVPSLVAGLLDKRAAGIQEELDDARALREEAESILAEFESKQREVGDHSERIIAAAKESAAEAAEQAREEPCPRDRAADPGRAGADCLCRTACGQAGCAKRPSRSRLLQPATSLPTR